ncbi:TIM barrel protein [Paenibacillus qinlingensis]|nr:TIM barrel protein [Paenibacillus qinlingensis]
MLNNMVDADFITALDKHVRWGIPVLDLKQGIFGKSLIDLTLEEAEEAAAAIEERDLSVYCFSTELFHGEVEQGAAFFRTHYLDKIDHLLDLAQILKPTVIRLLSAKTNRRNDIADSTLYILNGHAWLIPMYQEAIDRIAAAGFEVTIENECSANVFATPKEIIDFFHVIDRVDRVYFTYDVQNLWQMGTYPTLSVYRELAPVIGFYHVKGGQKDEDSDKLIWKSSLEDASWPVAEMTLQVIADGRSPVICINPSHGTTKPGYNYDDVYQRDLAFMTNLIHGGE